MNAFKIEDEKVIGVKALFNRRLTLVWLAHGGGHDLATKSKREDTFKSNTSLLPVTRVDAANLIRAWQEFML